MGKFDLNNQLGEYRNKLQLWIWIKNGSYIVWLWIKVLLLWIKLDKSRCLPKYDCVFKNNCVLCIMLNHQISAHLPEWPPIHWHSCVSQATYYIDISTQCVIPHLHYMFMAWWWSWLQVCKARDCRSSLHFSICVCEPTGFFKRDLRTVSSHVCANKTCIISQDGCLAKELCSGWHFQHFQVWLQWIFSSRRRFISSCVCGNIARNLNQNMIFS